MPTVYPTFGQCLQGLDLVVKLLVFPPVFPFPRDAKRRPVRDIRVGPVSTIVWQGLALSIKFPVWKIGKDCQLVVIKVALNAFFLCGCPSAFPLETVYPPPPGAPPLRRTNS